MQAAPQISRISKPRLWTGRILSTVIVLLLLFDCVGKFMKPAQVVESCIRMGWPLPLMTAVGSILLICTILYAIPRTSILGAILLTGYLGGAVATNLRAGSPIFEVIFPVLFGVLVWTGLFLRDDRLCALTA